MFHFCNLVARISFYLCHQNKQIKHITMVQLNESAQTSHSKHCSCSGQGSSKMSRKTYFPAILSFILLTAGLLSDHFFPHIFIHPVGRILWYALAYLPVGLPVINEALKTIRQKDLFNEFTLMTVATIGAFGIGEYPEGVAVMLFYTVGELFQESAVNKAKSNIKALLDIRPDKVTVKREGIYQDVSPTDVKIGEVIEVKAGEKVPLDGVLLSPISSFNTSALTGESIPRTIRENETILAGSINMDRVIEIRVEKKYEDSSLSRILEMVQDAASRKAKTELLIRKFAHIYTPVVFFLALAITFIPYFFVSDYIFKDQLYKALVFLVISCPCALVVSIPLGYFGGIGSASRHGILFKGANYLDRIASVDTVVMDKTGTLTKGIFKVRDVKSYGWDKDDLIKKTAAIESRSNHPVAKAIVAYAGNQPETLIRDVIEIAGYGLQGLIGNDTILAGNTKLMKREGIDYDPSIDSIIETVVLIAINTQFAGYFIIADEIKDDAKTAIREMKKAGVKRTVLLSGDKESIAWKIGEELGIDYSYGDLLPEDKVRKVEEIKKDSPTLAFVGDGINDAPVLALSDIGIAMGGMGAEAAIEVADVVIQTDQPSRIATAIRIARATRNIVYQNIIMAFSVKLIVMIFATMGIANMWEAVFADVGVALLAILNAVRIMKKRFD